MNKEQWFKELYLTTLNITNGELAELFESVDMNYAQSKELNEIINIINMCKKYHRQIINTDGHNNGQKI